jgi:uncharacterized protein with HEPN domain
MSSRNWQLRLQDILTAIKNIQSQTANLNFNDFEKNQTIVKAVLYDLIVIGEAAVRVDPEIKERYNRIPWRLMGDLRNVVTHQYFEVNLTIIWNTIKRNLPPLVNEIELILSENLDNN